MEADPPAYLFPTQPRGDGIFHLQLLDGTSGTFVTSASRGLLSRISCDDYVIVGGSLA